MMKIFVDSQGNWQEYQEWHDEVVMNEPNRFKIVEVDGLPSSMRSPKFSDGKFVEPPVVEYIPTKEEKINAIKSEYEPRFKKLQEAQQKLMLMGKPTATLITQYTNLNAEMVARIKEVQ